MNMDGWWVMRKKVTSRHLGSWDQDTGEPVKGRNAYLAAVSIETASGASERERKVLSKEVGREPANQQPRSSSSFWIVCLGPE